MSYNHKEVELKWQKIWAEGNMFRTKEDCTKPKCYVLDMFPYPSGEGLHVGHIKGYTATDTYSRYKELNGFNILHPIGWDAFGLPAENYALKNKMHPEAAVKKNIDTFKSQLSVLGVNYDWEREISTTDPEYYKWTQWIFIKLYNSYYDEEANKAKPIEDLIEKKYGHRDYYKLTKPERKEIDDERLAFEEYEPINWCPSCKTGLANEDLEDGNCERCGSEIEQKPMLQWVLRIKKYADRMLYSLDSLDWESMITDSQRNWIGRSEGAEIDFKIEGENNSIRVYTTRPDTLFGATFMVIAPEHPLIEKLGSKIKNIDAVRKYQQDSNKKTAFERVELAKDKTGVRLEGISAINPVNNEKIEIWTADYVMMNYATGAIMAVPAHDERDYEFANKFGIKIIEVISGGDIKKEAYTGDGVLVNSDFLNDLNIAEAKKKMIEWLVEKGIGTKKVNYRIQDWGFSRQRYWGEPIPMIYCPECGNVPLKEEDLPLTLPKVDHYELSGTGESPLVNIKDWINVKCPICGKGAKREANTMPQWAGSSWYYLRYIDNKNNNELVNKDKENYWMNIDMYVGGAEHATRHLIYARFWHKFLYDIGVVSTDEPFKRLQHVGLVMAEDGRKMSKRFVNVVNPSDVIENFGADTLRLYEMFMGDFKKTVSWSTNGVKGSRRFLERVWNLQDMVTDGDEYSKECESLIHKTIKKVGEDFEEFKFNTAIAMMMTLVNKFYEIGKVTNKEFKTLLTLLNPLTPHITEEIWQARGYTGMIKGETWPKYDKEKLIDDTIEVPIQVNGKLRAKIVIDRNEDEASVLAKARREMEGMLDGKEIVKEIYVGGKIVNMVVR